VNAYDIEGGKFLVLFVKFLRLNRRKN